MKNISGVLLAAAVLLPRLAVADAGDFLRTGSFPTRDGTLAQGVTVSQSLTVDVDRDGTPDELVSLVPGGGGDATGLALIRHDASGWRGVCIDCEDSGGIDGWRQIVTLPTGIVAVQAHDGQGDGANNVHEIMLFWLAPRAAPVLAYTSEDGNSFDGLLPLPDGSLAMVTVSPARYRTLSWNAQHSQLHPSAPSATAPAGAIPARGTAGVCTAQSHSSVHVRPTELPDSSGPEVAANTQFNVLSAGSLLRGTTRMYRVIVPATGVSGYAFFAPNELAANCPH